MTATQHIQRPWDDANSLIFLAIGMIVVLMFAWRRFNEPSFPNNDTLPRTVDPLRYLFISSAYTKARLVYSLGFIFLYVLLVLPGPSAASLVGVTNLPTEGWALAVAIVIVQVAPNAGIKWLNLVEETWRKWVHSWFLVPDGIVKTAAILQEAKLSLTPEQFENLPEDVRLRIEAGLQLPPNSLRGGWARAQAMLDGTLRTGAFSGLAAEPFKDDFDDIKKRYRALRDEIAPYLESTPAPAACDGIDGVDTKLQGFLRSVYIYISWLVLYSAQNERDVDQKLEDFGFSIPPRGGRRTFDLMATPAIMVGFVTLVFWLAAPLPQGKPGTPAYDAVAHVMTAAAGWIGNSLFYGLVLYLALHLRSTQIEEKAWMRGSPRCLGVIAMKTGFTAYVTIVVVGVVSALIPVWLKAAVREPDANSVWGGVDWLQKLLGSTPWALVGATVGVMVARSVGVDIERTTVADRIKEGLRFGAVLALVAGVAQLLQNTINQQLLAGLVKHFHASDQAWIFITNPLEVGTVGAACGAIIGFTVPYAFRMSILEPADWQEARNLQDLIDRATTAFGSAEKARDWAFSPTKTNKFAGLTPAEALGYRAYAPTVMRYVKTDVAGRQLRAAAAKELCANTPAPSGQDPHLEDHP
jgi:hypothetical protein